MNKLKEVVSEDKTQKLRKDIETIAEWRKSGRAFTKEQDYFAGKVVDRMLSLKIGKQFGVQVISADNVAFLKKYESSDRQSDETSYGSRKTNQIPRVSAELKDIAKPVLTAKPVAKGTLEVDAPPKKNKELNISEKTTSETKRNTPNVGSEKLKGPKNHDDGEVTSVATDKVPAAGLQYDSSRASQTENIGHNPQLPMPTKIAEELVQNAKWGVKVGAYTNEQEGIDAQLTRKDYAEFIDTPEKLKALRAYLTQVSATLKDPKKI